MSIENMTKDEVIALLKENTRLCNSFFHSEASAVDDYIVHPKWFDAEEIAGLSALDVGGVTLKCKDNFGGEGMGDDYWSVYEFTTKDGESFLLKFDGYYASYSGAEFNEFFEVEAKEVVKVEFFKKS